MLAREMKRFQAREANNEGKFDLNGTNDLVKKNEEYMVYIWRISGLYREYLVYIWRIYDL